jgi:cytoskeletal protein CcmA (bactofilin family)
MKRHVKRFDKDGADSGIDDADVGANNERSANFNLSGEIGVADCKIQLDWSARVDDDIEITTIWINGRIEDDVGDFYLDLLSVGRVVFDVEAPAVEGRSGVGEGDFAPNDSDVPLWVQEEFVPLVEITFSGVVCVSDHGIRSGIPIRIWEASL